MQKKKLSQEQIEELKKLKEETEANGGVFVYSQIAKEYGISGVTLRRYISPTEYDLKPKKNNPDAVKEYQKKKMKKYMFNCMRDNPTDATIITHMDNIDNKQQYLKGLVLQDIEQNTETEK